jgi:hypothetical protein
MLDPPPAAICVELKPFTTAETAANLLQYFPDASIPDVAEFHRLSSENPRVQAISLSSGRTLDEILRNLGPNPTTVEDTIERLLESAVAKVRDAAGSIERSHIDRICTGLAVLRPLIPIFVLADLAGVEPAAIKSFALDLHRPLLVTGDSIQFLDEPAETWFQRRFKPNRAEMGEFIEKLMPLAASSAYVASVLPALLLEACRFAELVDLALSSKGLPESNPIERRDVELQRLQFALKAALREKRYLDATKLALKAGAESAGDRRQRSLLQQNTDLAARFVSVHGIQEIVSRRSLISSWMGSHNAYEAGLMSGRSELHGEARSKLRMAHDWLRNWLRLPEEQKRHENIADADLAEMAAAHFNIHGPMQCAEYLRNWRPREVSFRAGRILAARFIDAGRYEDLEKLAVAAGNDLYLVLGIAIELKTVQRNLSTAVAERTLRLVLNRRVHIEFTDRFGLGGVLIEAVTALLVTCVHLHIGDNQQLSSILTRYLPNTPPQGLSSHFTEHRFPYLRAYSLRSALDGECLAMTDLAYSDLRDRLQNKRADQGSQEIREFEETIGVLLPWHRLWADTLLGRIEKPGIAAALGVAESISSKVAAPNGESEYSNTSNEIAKLWLDILLESGATNEAQLDTLNQWIDSRRKPLSIPTTIHLARVTARSNTLQAASLKYAQRAFEMSDQERTDAGIKTDSYISVARAILTVSEAEANAYFNEAVQVASRTGDENLDRWTALLDLAEAAASQKRTSPEIADKFARCAELTYDYVARDKHFDWEATITAVAGLDASSAITILSRWRDRRFGRTKRLLTVVIEFLLERKKIDGRSALSLVGFRAAWGGAAMLSGALESCTTSTEKQTASSFLIRYMALQGQTAAKWRALKDVVNSASLSAPEVDKFIVANERSPHQPAEDRERGFEFENEPDWDGVFANTDFSESRDILRAYARFKDSDPPYQHEHFYREAWSRIRVGQEAGFLTAIAGVQKLNLYDLRKALEQIPPERRHFLSVKSALTGLVKIFFRRYCQEITNNRYEIFPLDTACEVSGIPKSELIEVVLSGIAENAEAFGARRMFTLVGLLAAKLPADEALDGLSFGLELLESALQEKDGDGPWSAGLLPPTDLEASLAGYVWGALGDPKATVRWEAAHVVRALCELGREQVVAHLISLANQRIGGPFIDASLPFYALHARQWLLIALARAAKDSPAILAPHAGFLIEAALNCEPHVLIRGFAAQAVLALFESCTVQIDLEMRRRIATVNVSPFPKPAPSKASFRSQSTGETEDVDDDGLSFALDIGPYWFEPLARRFGVSQGDIERAARQVIRIDLRYSGTGRWIEDARTRRGLFRQGETYHSHTSYPRTDDLFFYLSYHATMIVAGKLLASVPVNQTEYEPEDGFPQWLSEHGLTRTDGKWVADRRDPAPLGCAVWKHEKETSDWRWSICREDFDQALCSGGRLAVWGHWTTVEGHQEESIAIQSALVSSERSEALLRALQTANPSHYCIPDADSRDELQISYGEFQLKGWISSRATSLYLDDHDPWAGDIRYPAPVPAQFVVDSMQLESDSEYRGWRMHGDTCTEPVIRCELWGEYKEKDDEGEREGGTRLQASFPFVIEMLRRMHLDLIIEVQIDRFTRRSTYESSTDDYTGFLPRSTRLFLAKADGNLYTI